MEYISGQDLKGLIRQTGQLTIGKTVSIAKQICNGLYDNTADPFQMNNLAARAVELPILNRLRIRLKDFLAAAHDDFLPGTGYSDWFDDRRNLIRTGLGPVNG